MVTVSYIPLHLVDSLDISNLNGIQNSIWAGRVEWENIGLNLGIEYSTLEVIKSNNPQNVDRCFREMLAKWLQLGHETTLNCLICALRSPSVGFEHLADELELNGNV